MSDVVQLTLPTWVVGSMKIRFIYLVNNTSFRLSESPKVPAIPLYLGADLVSNTNIRSENHPRLHAKFARKGLATKLKFPSGYRFHGLRLPVSNSSLWFYSVQGLFRIAFEMFSKQEQLSVLENFQDVWKSHIDDDRLQMGYNLSEQLDVAEMITRARNETLEPFREVQIPQDTTDNSKDHDYCSHAQEIQEEESHAEDLASYRQQIQRLNDRLPQIQPEQLKMLELFLDFIDSYIQGDPSEITATEVVMTLLRAKQWEGVYSSVLLRSLGLWLGQQFREANGSISQKVEDFKLRHIDRISDLPAAEELTKELFPEAMLSLLLHWMGLSEDSSLDKRRSEYPILLLILEFANHNLVTGAAHVLYSSLICK